MIEFMAKITTIVMNLNLSFPVRTSKTKNHTDLGYTINPTTRCHVYD